MTFNEFNRELEKRIPDPQMRYMLGFMFETMLAQQQQLDELAALLLNLAEQQQVFVQFNEQTQQRLSRVMRGQRPDGVEVQSVLNEPEV